MRSIMLLLLALVGSLSVAHAQSVPHSQFSGGGVDRKMSNEELQKRCDGGEAIACDDLGVRYLKGDGAAKDLTRSAALFRRACDGGDSVGCYDLAESYRFGDGVAKDMKAASAFYQRACDGKVANACAELAILYNDGEGVSQDDSKAALFADRSCKGGASLGCALLASVYVQGTTGYPKDVAKAEQLFTNACFDKANFNTAPDVASQIACSGLTKLTGKPACTKKTYSIGSSELICFEAPGTWKVTEIPVEEPKSANDSVAVANAAVYAGNAAYESKDFVKAAGHYASACDNGSVAACGKLGEMYVDGQGLMRNAARAAPLLAKACDGALPAACAKLGQLYDKGDGVQPNKTRAFNLFDGACSQSIIAACYNLGRLYEGGQGTAANMAQAATFYQKACNGGVADGCSGLGAMHSKGVYFAKDLIQAEYFFNLACSKGGKQGCDYALNLNRDRIEKKKEEIAVAEFEKNKEQNVNFSKKNPIDCIVYFDKIISGCREIGNGYCEGGTSYSYAVSYIRNKCSFTVKVLSKHYWPDGVAFDGVDTRILKQFDEVKFDGDKLLSVSLN
jgi:uncharacterized protein